MYIYFTGDGFCVCTYINDVYVYMYGVVTRLKLKVNNIRFNVYQNKWTLRKLTFQKFSQLLLFLNSI